VENEHDRPHAAGCVVYRYDEAARPLVLMIKDQYGRWTLPKGHLEPGEEARAAAARETLEETGVSGDLGAFVGTVTYPVTTRQGGTYVKRVAFYLLRAASAEVTPEAAEGISAAGWFPPAEALARNGYYDMRATLVRALELVDAGRAGEDPARS
jgi:8-oxo-dGTP pyrophosphatase MutT (NUDIX family)